MIVCPKCQSFDVTGHEIRGVYDGVLFWSCGNGACRWHWSRDWTGYGHREEIADQMVAEYNAALFVGGAE